MIDIKTDQEIAIMVKGGKILAGVLYEVLDSIKPGVSELEIDALAEKLIRQKGGEPGFQKVPGYKHTICVSTNEVVVHGIPTTYKFQEGDVVGIDCGVYLDGYHTDMSHTVRVRTQNQKDDIDMFIEIGERALNEAIHQAKPGNRIGHISQTIQSIVEGAGYSVVRGLIGHGVGKELHEEPEVPGFLRGSIAKTPELVPGMTIAIEVIYNMGKKDVTYTGKDDWTISTADGSLSGLFERTVAITKAGPIILTQ